MVPQDVSTIHVTEVPKIVATSMVPTSWPEFLGTTLIPQERTTFEMRPSILGTTIVPQWELIKGFRYTQQVLAGAGPQQVTPAPLAMQQLNCFNCASGGFLQAARKPPKGYSCCPKLAL
jgi:hypothetical protein